MLRFEDHRRIGPSYIGSLVSCTRRFWLNAHHIRMDLDGKQQKLKSHEELDELGFQAEVALPDLSRIDYWHPEERLCVEIKHAPPSIADVFQVKEMQTRLNALGVGSVEYQLWYPSEYEDALYEFCKSTGYDMMETVAGYMALLIHDIEDEDVTALNRARTQAQSILGKDSPPAPFHSEHAACQHCGYADFCHVRTYNDEESP